jgi:outer membrane protein assembly factor BamB
VRILRGIIITVIILILIPVIAAGLSFIGRVSPGSVIPDSFGIYWRAPNPARLAAALLAHDSLPEILALPELAPALPVVTAFTESGLMEKAWFRFACRGAFEGALLGDGGFLAAWDMGVLSPLMKVIPFFSGSFAVPGLYYVKAGNLSRFEYRADNGVVFYLGPYHNLLVVSNSSKLFESAAAGTSREGDRRGEGAKAFSAGDFDAGFLFSPVFLEAYLRGADPVIAGVTEELQFSGPVEALFTISPRQIDVRLDTTVSAGSMALAKILSRNSDAQDLSRLLPGSAQYVTLLAAGSLQNIMEAAVVVPGSGVEVPWKQVDSSARTFLGMNTEELLYSWTGEEFAIFGLEGRPDPVILMEIRDERKRREVFDKAFKTIVLNEDIRLNLDGTRLPRVEMPGFLLSLLLSMGIHIPSPYYTVHDGALFMSESAESLLAAVNAVRKNDILLKTDLWKTLSKNVSAKQSFTVFYSLDRSLPFFLRGNSPVSMALGLYRQGLLQAGIENRRITVSLSAVPGPGGGIVSLPPVDIGGKAGNQVYALPSGKAGESRILLTKDGEAVSINPSDMSMNTYPLTGSLSIIPADGISGAVWIVNFQGRVVLADRDLVAYRGFPLITGLRLSAPPEAHNGRLYICGEDGTVYTVDEKASVEKWGVPFGAALRSPPSFIRIKNKTYAAFYPKSFLGEIWVTEENGAPLPGWPVPVSGIAFGSPLLFTVGNSLRAAFVTQAGELSVYNERGALLPGFPLYLDGVFYIQPVSGGESLWLVAADGVLFNVDLEGNVLSQKIPNLDVRENGFLAAVDADGDKKAEIFVTGEGNALYGYSESFNSLEHFPLPVWGRPAFADLNGDKKMEITGAGMDNKVYRWQFR